MDNVIYFSASLVALVAIWFVWDLGIKRLMLDQFRERLFELRFDLFKLGAEGRVSFDDEAYRAIETLICGLLRFGHRATFMSFFFSSVEQREAKKADVYVDFHQQMRLKIGRTTPSVQLELNSILAKVSRNLLIYTSFTSLLFMFSIPLIRLMHHLNMLRNVTKNSVSSVLESEAYRAEERKPHQGEPLLV